ncbi:MAG: CvpA family protein [Clostridia bacterium]|nr:CvpA family protein [Clostridia bacterium]
MNTLLASSAFFTLGGVNVAIVDAVVLAILLVFFIVGAVKGFMAQVLSVLGWIAGVVAAILLVDSTVNLVYQSLPGVVTFFDGVWADALGEQFSGITDAASLRATLEASTIPAFLHESIITLVGENVANALSFIVSTLTSWTLTAICFILIFIIAMIVFALIKKLFKFITSLPVIKQADKLLGGCLGLLEAFIIILVLSVVLSVFPWFNELLTPVTETGESVVCVFSVVYEAILGLPFIQEFLAGFQLAA